MGKGRLCLSDKDIIDYGGDVIASRVVRDWFEKLNKKFHRNVKIPEKGWKIEL